MKKIFIALCCLLFAVPLCFVGCAKDKNTIRVCEVTHSIFYAPMYIAINKGYFDEYDIKIELTNGGGADKCMTALVSKSADISLMGPEATIYVANQGKQDMPVVFGQLTKRDGSFIIGRENVANFSWDQLNNKEILGGRRGGVPAMTLEYAIKKNNVQNCTINEDVAFDNVTSAFVGRFVEEKAEGYSLSGLDLNFITSFYSNAIVGSTIKWIENGMKKYDKDIIKRISDSFEATIYDMIECCMQ